MPVRLIFRCQFCETQPDEATQASLEFQLSELEWGQYSDAGPGRWLIWHGKGIYGPTRYACAEHRIALRDYLRAHYGSVGWHPHARVLGDLAPEVHRELQGPPVVKRQRNARQRWLRRNSGFAL